MKTYRLDLPGGPYVLAGLVDGVKENLEDIVQARERRKLARQLKKKLIDEAEFALGMKSVEAISFDSVAVLSYAMMERDGQRHLIRELLEAGGKPPKDLDAAVGLIHAAYQDEDSDAHQTFARIWGDAYPKKAPTGSGSTAPSGGTGGGPSCAASPGDSPTTSVGG